ncbi:hypothetical protein D9M72_584960 [compost metagenome]
MPHNDAPISAPQPMVLTRKALMRAGAYSYISVTAPGTAAPTPMPVKKRQAPSDTSESAVMVPRLHSPNSSIEPTITVFGLVRLNSGPAISAPSASPSTPTLSTGPNAALVVPHSRTSTGTTKPMATLS